jgi:glycosyltransferase involved in cell wall biosynthesis
VIRLPKNVGHAGARQAAMNAATNDLVAIMDADDISVNNRFELQLKAYTLHADSAVIGGQIKEFVGEQTNVVGERIVPEKDKDIKAYLKSRCPMNFVTVMYRKSAVENVGGFIDWYCEEDYYLWIRLAQQGYKFYNLPDNLVNVRVGEEMYQRRGGWRYFKSEARLQRYMLNHHIISLPRYLYNVLGRFALQVAMPNKIRGVIFQKLLRKN